MRLLPCLASSGLLLLLCPAAPRAHAGGGPETTVVVVNGDSPVSRRVANAYVERRRIPASHLVTLEGLSTLRAVDVDTFRERLWKPVKQALTDRGLLETTDLLAWSADFPFGVDVSQDAKAAGVAPMPNVPFRAALTSLTYFWQKVEQKDAQGYLDLMANHYCAPPAGAAGSSSRRLSEAEAALYRQAEQALRAKDWGAARDAYLKLLESDPRLVVAWYNLACCHARLGDASKALEALGEAVDKGWAFASDTAGDADLESLRAEPAFLALLARMREQAGQVKGPQGFRSAYGWKGAGERESEGGDRYLLSVMLGYTGEWGNSVPEVLECLERGAASDGTQPDGTVYLCRSEDGARTGPREPFFDGTLAALERMGRKGQLLKKGDEGQDGALPRGKDDVIGAVLGVAGFSWKDAKSRMLPGAIVEHLTSYGADFSHGGQTKLAEALRGGAAGSCGTVAEPLNAWMKFPLPTLHVHYAAGCSLAESFYRSLAGPWQTLVVGDPLARPYARFAQVEVPAPPSPAPVSGTVAVQAALTPAPGTALAGVELWVDGRLRATGAPDQPLSWDTTQEDDGVHEVRVVAIEAGPVETRSFGTATWTVGNLGRSITLVGPKGSLEADGEVTLAGKVGSTPTGSKEPAKEVDVLHGAEVLATVPVRGGAWRAPVRVDRLGLGKPEVVVRARYADGRGARSAALVLHVVPPAPAKPAKPVKQPKPAKTPAVAPQPGLALSVVDAQGKSHEGALSELTTEALRKALDGLKVAQAKRIVLEGEMEVGADGLYQLVAFTAGGLEVEWVGRRVLSVDASPPDRLRFALAALTAGWNRLRLTLEPSGSPTLGVLLSGDAVAVPLGGKSLRH